ncbi:MAG: hypothetical protein PQJ50_17150 [Spirochaetales bacterium]|nr:hypothetical protein [Spirochaetales bacterium]
MKKIITVSALVLMSSAALFASGNKDADDTENYRRGNGARAPREMPADDFRGTRPERAPQGFCYDENGELIELEEITARGTLVLEEGSMAYLNTDDGKVFLMVPPFAIYDLELEGGEDVEVTGYDMPANGMMAWGQESVSTWLRVTSAVIDGEELDLSLAAGPGRGGFRGGANGGRGGRGCW